MLKGENIRKSYGDVEILHGIDINIQPGTITTIIGPSGSGKSTLLRSLALLDPPTSGTVTIDDLTMTFPHDTPIPTELVWPRLTVVFQQLFLWPHLTLRQNAVLPLRSRDIDSPEDRVDQIIKDFGINGLADRFPNEVSLGQRQLGAIVRALALEPRYLLLDEITSALDVEYVAMILERLKTLREQGVALLLISHLIEFARHSGDQIVFLDGGTLVEQGTPAILDNPQSGRLERFLGLVLEAR
ncbi:MAG: amino acid ABC transporter ATP-binding protein [Desulfuromonadales bacterium]|nr:amino acid ABC transporter ATP-binding protein [Desulfuromonadales bacterium]